MSDYKNLLNRYIPISLEEELAQAKPDAYKPTGEAFESLPEVVEPTKPNLITDPEAIRAARLAEIEATYKANPNRAIESAAAFESLGPNFEMVGEPTASQKPNFKLQGSSYTPDILPAKIDAPVPAVRAKAELPDVLVRGYSAETPMTRLMGRYPNAAMGVAGLGALGVDRYLQTKDTNEPFFNPKSTQDQADVDFQKIMDVKNGKSFPFSPDMKHSGELGKMPSESDLSPLSKSVDLSKYMMTQPEVASREDNNPDPTAANRKALNRFFTPDNSPLGKSIAESDAKEQAQREADLRTKQYNFEHSPAVDPRMLEPLSKSVDLSKYFGNGNTIEMNAKLPPTDKTQPNWSADATPSTTQDKKAQTPAQPKLSSSQVKSIQANPEKANQDAKANIQEANKVLSSEDLTDKEYEDAIKQRNMNEFIATMTQASTKIGAAMAGANAQVIAPDLAYSKQLMEQAGRPVTDLKDKRKANEELVDSKRKKALRDPNSPESKQIQEMMAKVAPSLSSAFAKMSGQDILDRSGIVQAHESRLSREQIAKQHAERISLDREAMKDSKTNAQDVKFATTNLKKIREGLVEESKNLDSAMNAALEASDNPQALAGLAPLLVKVYEGKGARVTDEDRKAAIGASGFMDKMKQYVQRGMTGTLPQATKGQIINFLQKMSDVHKKAAQRAMDGEIEAYAKVTKRPLSEIGEQLGHSGTKQSEEASVKPTQQSTKPSWAK